MWKEIMQLEDLMIKKEEIPILYECCSQVPIHPKLLSQNININENVAREVFSEAAEEWYIDLKEHWMKLENKSTKEWIKRVFLKKKPRVIKEYFNQKLNTIGWRDRVFCRDNGFAYSLSINRNFGGTLYFNKEDSNCREFYLGLNIGYIRFPKNKASEFDTKENAKFTTFYIYGSHNIDNYPGALFLRNWAILYLNKAMKQILE